MTSEEISAAFERHEDEYLKWDRVPAERRRHCRKDIHVFLTLHDKFPSDQGERGVDMIAFSQHDEYGLEVNPEDENTLDDDDVRDLVRAGLRLYDGSFCMFA